MGISGAIAIDTSPALAQSKIIPDRTLGAERSIVIPNSGGFPVEEIRGGAIRGANLFHSFQDFNVSVGRGAYFFSPSANIQNILARVTGNNPSQILGTLGTFGQSNPNLFLINPNGIIFGPNARLDVGGSFVASTASAIKFANGKEFSATNPKTPPLLTINVPLGLQYSGNPGSVVVQGSELQVPNGQTLALVGGAVSLDGASLQDRGGRVELGAVAGTGTVGLNVDGSNLSLNFPQGVALADISLTNGAEVNVRAGGGGSIAVNAQNLNLAQGSALLAGIDSGLGSTGSVAGNIEINATGAINLTDESDILNSVLQGAKSQGGDINITAKQLYASDGSQVAAGTFGAGNGGNLTVNASSGVQLSGTSANSTTASGLFAQADIGSSGKAGDLTINTSELLIWDGAQVSAGTFGTGNGGKLTVNASQAVQLIGSSTDGQFFSGLSTSAKQGSSGKAGDLTINTSELLIRDGAYVSAGTSGTGNGGKLTVNASQAVQLIGSSTDGQFSSGLFAQASKGSSGKAGDLTINTSELLVRDGAKVSAGTSGTGNGGNLTVNASQAVQLIGTSADGQFLSGLFASAEQGSSGKAGDLTVNTSELLIRDGAQVVDNTFSSGQGGNLTVNASSSVRLIGLSADGKRASGLYAQTLGTGDAGNLTITTGQLLVSDVARVDTGTLGAGNGGDLTVNASSDVQLIGSISTADGHFSSSLLTSTERGSTGKAGNLTINTSSLLVQDGAQVSASTSGSGKGGNLTVNASSGVQLIGTSADSQTASGLFAQADKDSSGKAGDLTINTSSLLVRDGAQVSASTIGSGDAGNLTVNASSGVQLIGTAADGHAPSSLTAQADIGSSGKAGELTINTSSLLVRDGAQVAASTFSSGEGGNLKVNVSQAVQVIGTSADGRFSSALFAEGESGSSGKAGDLTINTSELLVRDGARVAAGTFGSGEGGNLTVKASDSVQLFGPGSGLLVNATAGSTAGNLTVETKQMSISDQAGVSVSSPKGQAGNMIVQANSLLLNRGRLSAETAKSGTQGGANITLSGLDLLRMDNESLISANALDQANGGNVTIDSTFIVATPPTGSNGSDITANAGKGNGGQVNITTQGLYGIKFRPNLTPKNDITVTSDFGLNGTFQLNTPGVDPSRGLANLQTETIDASRQIVQDCRAGGAAMRKDNKFIITGRGGLPPSPNDMLQGESVVTNWVTLDSDIEKNNNNTPEAVTPSHPLPSQLVEAQGWVVNKTGQIVLTASSPTVTPQSEGLNPAKCKAVSIPDRD